MLEIGAAFGFASIAAAKYRATIFCNDISARNLAVLRKRWLKQLSVDGKDSEITFLPGKFPYEFMSLPDNFTKNIHTYL